MFKSYCENELCEGCSVLGKSKPFHSYMDYENCEEADVLFLSDSLKQSYGEVVAFNKRDMQLILDILSDLEGDTTFEFAASVKCPSCKDGDLTANDMHKCRVHLETTIDKVKPKLVYVCGNLPMRMLIKQSGLGGGNPKRGRTFEYESPEGHVCKVVPVFHPFSVIQEPKNRFLFELDIKNNYNTHILKKSVPTDFKYDIVSNINDLDNWEYLATTVEDIAVDIETTGLDFMTNLIYTISISCEDKTVVIPYSHPEREWLPNDMERIVNFIKDVMKNPNNDKALHNAKFDLKFLYREGVREYERVIDTALLSHFIDENTPNSLMECVNQYFPQELNSIC